MYMQYVPYNIMSQFQVSIKLSCSTLEYLEIKELLRYLCYVIVTEKHFPMPLRFFLFSPHLQIYRYLVTYVHQTIVSYCISRTMNSVSRAKILTIPPFEKFKRSAKLIMTELKEIHTCVQSSKYILYFYKNLNN